MSITIFGPGVSGPTMCCFDNTYMGARDETWWAYYALGHTTHSGDRNKHTFLCTAQVYSAKRAAMLKLAEDEGVDVSKNRKLRRLAKKL